MNEPESTLPVAAPRRRRWPWWVGGVLGAVLLLFAGAVWWAGRAGSLPQALRLAQRWLPAGQTLQFSDASGSIRGGGHVASLQWSAPGTSVAITDLTLQWSLPGLFRRELLVQRLQAQAVLVRLTPQSAQPPQPPSAPFVMPAELRLPVRVSLPLSVGSLQVENVAEDGRISTLQLQQLQAQYQYDGTRHVLKLGLRRGRSEMRADLSLHATDLLLQSQVSATLRDLVADTPLDMQADLQASGTLQGGDAARIDLKLDARADSQRGAQLHGEATIHPWRTQPVEQALLRLQGLDAHALHASAPVTALSGEASLTPLPGSSPQAWDMSVQFSNAVPGAWDAQRLPVRTLQARGRLDAERLELTAGQAGLAGSRIDDHIGLTGRVAFHDLQQSALQLQLRQIDLRSLLSSLPRSAIQGQVSLAPPAAAAPGAAGSSKVSADIRNTLPGSLDAERLPLDALRAELQFAPERWSAESLQLQVGEGSLRLQGQFEPRTQNLDLRGDLQRLPLRRIHRRMARDLASELSGTLSARGNLRESVAFESAIHGNAAVTVPRGEWEIRAAELRGQWQPARLQVERIHVDAFQATMDGRGIDIALPDLGTIRAQLSATAPGLRATASGDLQPTAGDGTLDVEVDSAGALAQWLRGLPIAGEQWPALRAAGSAKAQLTWQGGWQQWRDGLRHPAAYPRLRLDARIAAQGLDIIVPATAAGAADMHVEVGKLAATLQGNLAAASVAVTGDARVNAMQGLLDLRVQARQQAGSGGVPRWSAAVEHFQASATLPGEDDPWQLRLSDGLQATLQWGQSLELRSTAGTAQLVAPAGHGAPLELAWEPMLWRQAAGANIVQSRGTIRNLQPAWLDLVHAKEAQGALTNAGLRTDLVLDGSWDVQMTERLAVAAQLQRVSGDAWMLEPALIPGEESAQADRGLAAGIRKFALQVRTQGEGIAATLDWDTERAGVIAGRVNAGLARKGGGWTLPDTAPLSGTLRAQIQDLGAWSVVAPPGWRVQGRFDADLALSGTVKAPQLRGTLQGDGLKVRSVLDGVELHEGTLRATLEGTRLAIAELRFEGGSGSRAYISGRSGNRTRAPSERGRMDASGTIDWSALEPGSEAASAIRMDMRATLQRMQVLVRNDRQMTLSGELSAGLQQGALQVRGDLSVDRATIKLPEASAPTLGNDVVVLREGKPAVANAAAPATGHLETARPLDLEVKLNLGRDLALEGQGITTRLEGELTVRSKPGAAEPFAVVGEVRTVEGKYRAWGQALDVETGVVLFNGSYSNPSLNLLAIRPEIEVRAGVRVTGTLTAPRVQLYSDPDLPEAEKLAWVVLGRATAVGGAEGSSMQQAALGVLAGRLASGMAGGLGLDELGLTESSVSIGKRLSDELYMTYEAGLAGAASTLYIFYDITRRLTVRGQTGEASAVDLIYTIKFD
ncbi:MAG: translocation/assembly module TamB domain-containing protein [Steroidobacteraceae bacterium]